MDALEALIKKLESPRKQSGLIVTEVRVRAAAARIVSRGWDNIHPEIVKVLQDKNDERFSRERGILTDYGML